jgi:hypothetical protein
VKTPTKAKIINMLRCLDFTFVVVFTNELDCVLLVKTPTKAKRIGLRFVGENTNKGENVGLGYFLSQL